MLPMVDRITMVAGGDPELVDDREVDQRVQRRLPVDQRVLDGQQREGDARSHARRQVRRSLHASSVARAAGGARPQSRAATRRRAVDARPGESAARSACGMLGVRERAQPRRGRRRIACREQVAQLPHERAIPVRAPHDEQALHPPATAEPLAHGLNLRLEATHRLATVEQQVPDLDHGGLTSRGTLEQHVDRP